MDKDVRRARVISLIDASPLDKRDPKDLLPYAQNSRTHSDYQIKQIADSIEEFGFTNPVLIDGHDEVIAGHGRVFAAMRLDLPKVPVLVLTHLSDAQRKAYVIADNKLALNAGWDHDLLCTELEELDNLSFDIQTIGFSDEELNAILEPLAVTNIESVSESESKPVTGSKEYGENEFRDFKHTCPKCGFEFDK